uniref:zinc finger BED domain-containing protein 6-like n=1 Tax=Styela clava TaxID=7725 RepID=UPI00193A02EC|nr:zinc finger BED domain-containing protein 6-like [Styela clava]
MRPINIVEGEHFRDLISNLEPGYEMPGRTFFGKQIETTYSQYKCKLMSILKEQNVISITTDAWTSIRMEAYITVTAHFVMAGELQNYVLSTTQIVGDQTGINLKSYILYVLNDFSIPPSSIFAIVTDNGANVVSACKILQTEHGWHHIRCAAHTLQLCIKDAIKNTEIARALGAARHLVQHFRRSAKCMTALRRHAQSADTEIKNIEMPIDVSTRWNSTFAMIANLVKNQWIFRSVLADPTIVPRATAVSLELKDNHWSLLREISIILKPFKTASDHLEGSNYVTMSSLLPIANSLVV